MFKGFTAEQNFMSETGRKPNDNQSWDVLQSYQKWIGISFVFMANFHFILSVNLPVLQSVFYCAIHKTNNKSINNFLKAIQNIDFATVTLRTQVRSTIMTKAKKVRKCNLEFINHKTL